MKSYHIKSDYSAKVLGLKPNYTIKERVQSLIDANKKGLVIDALSNHI